MKVKLKSQYITGKPRKSPEGKVVGIDETVNETGSVVDVKEDEARRLLHNGYLADPADPASESLFEKMKTEGVSKAPKAYSGQQSSEQTEAEKAEADEKAKAIAAAKAVPEAKRTAEQKKLLSENP